MPQVDAWVVEHSLAMLARLREIDPDVRARGQPVRATPSATPTSSSTIRDSLARHDVDPSALILEITETAAVADVALARAFAERMTELGCAFALDDFGAGLRVVLLPQAPDLRLREDRRRVRRPRARVAGRPHHHALDRRHRPRPGQADGGRVRLRRRRSSRSSGPRASTSPRASSSAGRCPTASSSPSFMTTPGAGGARGLTHDGHGARTGRTRDPCSGCSARSGWRSSVRRRSGPPRCGPPWRPATPSRGSAPTEGLLFGIWQVFYDTEMPSPRVLLAAVGVALLLAAGVAALERRLVTNAPAAARTPTGCRWRPSW